MEARLKRRSGRERAGSGGKTDFELLVASPRDGHARTEAASRGPRVRSIDDTWPVVTHKLCVTRGHRLVERAVLCYAHMMPHLNSHLAELNTTGKTLTLDTH